MVSICIDIGNTLTKVGIFEEFHMIYYQVIDADYISVIEPMFESYKIDAVVLSCVAEVPDQLVLMIQQKTPAFIILDQNTPIPIENLYNTKDSLGKDRLAAVIGASSIYPGENLLVIDAGTAITYDFINNRSHYIGGNISPGIQMRYKALHSFTKKLPYLNQVQDYDPIGTNTNDAIISGVLQGAVMEMEGMIHYFSKEFEGLRIVITGGDASFFDKKLKNTIFVVPNLVLLGLNAVIHYHINHAIL